MNITDFPNKIKGWVGEHRQILAISGILVISCALSFYMGYAARAAEAENMPKIGSVVSAPAVALQEPQTTENTPVPAPVPVASVTNGFVASKNGTKYYPSDCGSVSRIKPENKISFATAAAAEAKGYTLAAVCH